MSALTLRNISRTFGTRNGVRDLSVEIDSGEFFSVLGPSGCGKTTLLRLIAGFEKPDGGVIRLRGRDITYLHPGERGVAMVFQNYALFPKMNVFQNVAFGLRVKRESQADIERKVRRALEGVGLAERHASPVSELSGGEQQRVAVARSIVVEPEVLLFDEPLSNLDVSLRTSTRSEIKSLQARLGITTVYVTHDQSEALGLSTRVGIMHQGTLLQVGSPRETYDHPASPFVAEFLGAANLLNGEVTATTGVFTDGSLTLPLPKDLSNGRGGKLVLAIKPECILPATAGSENSLAGLVQLVEFQGPGVSVQFEYSARTLRATFPLAEGMRIPAAGETLHFRIDWPRCSLFWS